MFARPRAGLALAPFREGLPGSPAQEVPVCLCQEPGFTEALRHVSVEGCSPGLVQLDVHAGHGHVQPRLGKRVLDSAPETEKITYFRELGGTFDFGLLT